MDWSSFCLFFILGKLSTDVVCYFAWPRSYTSRTLSLIFSSILLRIHCVPLACWSVPRYSFTSAWTCVDCDLEHPGSYDTFISIFRHPELYVINACISTLFSLARPTLLSVVASLYSITILVLLIFIARVWCPWVNQWYGFVNGFW